jgi:mRNA interferase MazF
MARGRRGEIWLVDLGMAQKNRPAVILSVDYLDHERAVATFVPRTTRIRNTRFEVIHEGHGFESGAFDAQGIGSVPDVKLIRKLGILPPDVINKVEAAVRAWLAL